MTASETEARSTRAISRQLRRLARVPARPVIVVFFLNLAEAVMAVSGVAVIYPVLKYLQGGHDGFVAEAEAGPLRPLMVALRALQLEASLPVLLALVLIPILLQTVVRLARDRIALRLQDRTLREIRRTLHRDLLAADVDYFTHARQGRIAQNLTDNALRASRILVYAIKALSLLMIGAAYGAVLVVVSIRLALITAVIFLLVPLLMQLQGRKLGQLSGRIESAHGELYAFIGDRLRAVRKIQLLGTQGIESQAFGEVAGRIEKSVVHGQWIQAALDAVIPPVFILAALLIIGLGYGPLGLDVATLGVFCVALYRLQPSLQGALAARSQILIYGKSVEALARMREDLAAARTIVSGDRPFAGLREEIRLEDVELAYREGEPVLRGLSLSIPARTTTALVGRSGEGKSTLADLMLRFRDPQRGRVLVDGVDLRELDLASYRRRVGYLPQQPEFFHGTIRENLLYGLEGVAPERVEDVCRQAHADEFIARLAQGYETPIGEGAGMLSGGQRQRLALAQLLLHDPEVLILDEPTSALDAVSERFIRESIVELRGKRTILLIAHHMPLVGLVDRVAVLADGRIAEVTAPEDLREEEGVYGRLAGQG